VDDKKTIGCADGFHYKCAHVDPNDGHDAGSPDPVMPERNPSEELADAIARGLRIWQEHGPSMGLHHVETIEGWRSIIVSLRRQAHPDCAERLLSEAADAIDGLIVMHDDLPDEFQCVVHQERALLARLRAALEDA